MTAETDRKEKESRQKYTAIFPTGGGEATIPENMEALYASSQQWGTEEEGGIYFID